ncbi:MAG: hypothetical protein MZU91_00150 [Desulfosudis oleivorans]|nr:hypothetical protein [Desulfosudis oleivorans]
MDKSKHRHGWKRRGVIAGVFPYRAEGCPQGSSELLFIEASIGGEVPADLGKELIFFPKNSSPEVSLTAYAPLSSQARSS